MASSNGKDNGKAGWGWLLAFVALCLVLGVLNDSGSSGGGRPADVPGGIQWSTVTCNKYPYAGDEVEICGDAQGNLVSNDTAHEYGISAD